MGEFSIWHWLVVLLVVMLLFGGGKVSGLMGDLAKGIKSFKAVMAEDDPTKAPKPSAQATAQAAPPRPLEAAVQAPVAPSATAPSAAAPAEPAGVEANADRPTVDHTG